MARSLRRFCTWTTSAWLSVLALVFIASVQPSAYGLEFPTTTHVSVADAFDLTVSPTAAVGNNMVGENQTPTIISSNELAMVSLVSKSVEMARTPTGAKVVAKGIMSSEYGWNNYQYSCLQTLWTRESHWNYKAHNKRSGAHGIAQALPAIKMEVIATDWRTNPMTQIRWGLHYIDLRYSTPCNALAKFKRSHYY
ncbi:unannotated protein [freshwater metagenome]|jgi:hypothetical protein|uniref:Unannotated protein n=1 Tax=freshwater metagenome TaxID=449393 RepID=A0A6J6PGD3_9ZZZZ|nr:hypothetical protein [Actinomycetota bacterium]MSV86882.1 hypothetical protein [Actinomycetota bacterium]MSW68077.1 hypothetical protein [Actinomycetota bacterium]MSX28303.1 hypothetical protein [Actinomycetota bacterium]MSY03822.1 hypothetical protein [Actinomycetota bacterium]